MHATRTRLVRLGLVRPNTSGNNAASKAKAIGARRHELQRTVEVRVKGLSTIPRAN